MVSKKLAIILTILTLTLTICGVGVFFFVISTLGAESETVLLQRVERTQSLPTFSTTARENWDVSRPQFSAAGAQSAIADNIYHIGGYMPIFYHMGATEIIEFLPLHIVQILDTQGNWKHVRTVRGEKWINMDWLPGEMVLDVPGLNQQALGMPTGCEIVSLAMLINKYQEVCVFTLVDEMPRNFDPLLGFRGDPFTAGGFTILPPALMEMTERHLGSAVDMTGATIEEVQAHITRGRPVLAWVRGMFGFTVHVIVLTGFNEYGFFYNDSWLGGINEFISYQDFLAMWEDSIIDVHLNRTYPPRIALSF